MIDWVLDSCQLALVCHFVTLSFCHFVISSIYIYENPPNFIRSCVYLQICQFEIKICPLLGVTISMHLLPNYPDLNVRLPHTQSVGSTPLRGKLSFRPTPTAYSLISFVRTQIRQNRRNRQNNCSQFPNFHFQPNPPFTVLYNYHYLTNLFQQRNCMNWSIQSKIPK